MVAAPRRVRQQAAGLSLTSALLAVATCCCLLIGLPGATGINQAPALVKDGEQARGRALQGATKMVRRPLPRVRRLKIVQNSQDAAALRREQRRLGAKLLGGFALETNERVRDPPPAKLDDGRRAGKIPGSPTRAEFRFENIRETCASDSGISTRKMPLSLPLRRDPQHIFVTKATAQTHFERDRRWGPHMAGIEQWLPARTADVFANRRQFESCAIVGNHGNLRKAEWGAEIDRHEAVFRFNRGPTKDFEQWVGRRTTYRITNNAESRVYHQGGWRGGHKEDLPLDHNVTFVLSRVPPEVVGAYMKGIQNFVGRVKGKQGIMTTMLDKHFLMYTADVMNVYRKCAALHKHAKVDGFKTFSTPSTGVIAVLGTLHLCKHVTVYGVGETRMPGMPYQYFKNFGAKDWGEANTDVHNFELEAKFIKHLAAEGLIRKCECGQCYGKEAPPSVSA